MPGLPSGVVFKEMVEEVYFHRIPSYDRFPSDGVECPLGMELQCCDEARVPIRSESPTKPRRLRSVPRVRSEQRRKLLFLTAGGPEETQHSKKDEDSTREKAQRLQKGGGESGTEGGPKKNREEKENRNMRQEKEGEEKLKRKRVDENGNELPDENGGEERERELERKGEEECESEPLEGEKEEQEPELERGEKENETETPESEGGEEVKKTRNQTAEKKEGEKGEVELKREEKEKKDIQAHLLEKTEEEDDDDEEGERELKAILASRQRSGCSCKGRCHRETCECLQAGIHCRHTGFLEGRSGCACSSKSCNINKRPIGARHRRRNHYMQAMARFLLEKCLGDEDEEEK